MSQDSHPESASPAADRPAPEPDPEARRRARAVRFKVAGLTVLLLFVYLIPDIFYLVLPGEAAVEWYRFAGGTDVEDVRDEGLRVKWPWDRCYVYDVRLQQVTRSFPVLSNDGLHITVEVSIRFRVHRESLGMLHKHVGPDYVERLILPELGSHVREEISQFRPADFYAARRRQIQDQIRDTMDQKLKLDYEAAEGEQPADGDRERAIHVEDVLIRNILLPEKVADAIQNKLAQEQQMLEYDYRLDKEEKERQRKVIEAQGIREFQDIVTGGISERYLKWKGIDATLDLARSPNAKIVVIGASEDGLPIILGGLDTASNAAGGAASLPATPPGQTPPP